MIAQATDWKSGRDQIDVTPLFRDFLREDDLGDRMHGAVESRDAANFTGLVLGCIEAKVCK